MFTSESGGFDTGDAQLCAAGELLEALQQGTAGQGRRREREVDSCVTESASEDAAEAVPRQHLSQ